MKQNNELPDIYIIRQDDQVIDQQLIDVLREGGFKILRTMNSDELVDHLKDNEERQELCCYLVNPKGSMTLDPFHEMWSLKNHYLMPVILFGLDPQDPESIEMFRRLGRLYSVIKSPYIVEMVKATILAVTGAFDRAEREYSSSPWLAACMASISDGILIFDNRKHLRYGNMSAEQLLERPVMQLYNSSLDDIILVTNIHDSDVLNNGMSFIERGDLKRGDGSTVPVEMHQNAIYNVRKERVGTIVLIRDVRREIQARTTITEATKQEEQYARERGEFISNMSHELRTPLNSILGMADLALELADSSDQKEFLSLLKDSTRDLAGLVNTILDYAKLEARNMTLEYERFHIHGLIEKTLYPLISRAQGKNLRVYLEIQPGLPSIYRGDKERIAQVFEAIFDNAVKFTRSGYIVCSISERESPESTTLANIRQPVELIFQVQDSGIGLDAQEMERVFEPFYQADSAATRNFGGTGLGLSIARRLSMRMGGDISVSSTPGVGSIFESRIIVNREESELLYLNRKLMDMDVYSSQVTRTLCDRLESYTLFFISDDELWSSNTCLWLQYIGLKHRVIKNHSQLGEMSDADIQSGIFIHDIENCFVEKVGEFFRIRTERDVHAVLHILSHTPIHFRGKTWMDDIETLEWVTEPLIVPQILNIILTKLQQRSLRLIESESESTRLGSIRLVSKEQLENSELIDELRILMQEQGILMLESSGISRFHNEPGSRVDALIAFDASCNECGLIDVHRNFRRFMSAVERYRAETRSDCPVVVFLDAAAEKQRLSEAEQVYARENVLTCRLMDHSPKLVLSRLREMLAGHRSSRQDERQDGALNFYSIINRLRSETINGSFDQVVELSRQYQNSCKASGYQDEANALFRIQLAANRGHADTIFDILNNMTIDIEKKMNI